MPIAPHPQTAQDVHGPAMTSRICEGLPYRPKVDPIHRFSWSPVYLYERFAARWYLKSFVPNALSLHEHFIATSSRCESQAIGLLLACGLKGFEFVGTCITVERNVQHASVAALEQRGVAFNAVHKDVR